MKIKQAKGFSLIEMMVVLALLAIVLAMAVPQYLAWRDNQNLREAARDLSSDIALYRQRAVAENIGYRILLNQGANSYTIQREDPAGSNNYVNLSVLVPSVPPTNYDTKFLSNISARINIVGITFPGNQIIIQPRGTISPAGTVRLQHTGLPGREADIVTNLMGRTRIQYI